MTTVVLGILLGTVALGVVGVTLLLLVGPLRRPLLAALDRARFRRCVARQKRGDEHLAANDVGGALREFSDAFCFMVPRADARLLGDIARLHTGLLSRFVTIRADLPGDRVQLLALAKLERSLEQWTEAQRRAVRVPPSPTDGAELRRRRRLAQEAIRELARELMHRHRPPLLH